jgi:quercetin dioxygenase-like cupin family protein
MITTAHQPHPLLELGGSTVTEHLSGDQTRGALALLEFCIRPGYPVPPPHIHEHEDEITYVIEGALEVTVGDEVKVVRAGESIFKPRKVAHAFAIAGERPARFLETITPAGFERYFHAIGEMVRQTGAVDHDIANRLMSAYGLRNA